MNETFVRLLYRSKSISLSDDFSPIGAYATDPLPASTPGHCHLPSCRNLPDCQESPSQVMAGLWSPGKQCSRFRIQCPPAIQRIEEKYPTFRALRQQQSLQDGGSPWVATSGSALSAVRVWLGYGSQHRVYSGRSDARPHWRASPKNVALSRQNASLWEELQAPG